MNRRLYSFDQWFLRIVDVPKTYSLVHGTGDDERKRRDLALFNDDSAAIDGIRQRDVGDGVAVPFQHGNALGGGDVPNADGFISRRGHDTQSILYCGGISHKQANSS